MQAHIESLSQRPSKHDTTHKRASRSKLSMLSLTIINAFTIALVSASSPIIAHQYHSHQHLTRSKWPGSKNLPLAAKRYASLVLAVSSHVSVLVNVPALSFSCSSAWVHGCILQCALRLLPFLLTLALALHFALEKRFGCPTACLGLRLRRGTSLVFSTLLRCRGEFDRHVRLRLGSGRWGV
jgi:hypothetical protein